MSALRRIRCVTIKPTAKLVLYALADLANDYDETWPTNASLQSLTGLSERAIRQAISFLIAEGIVAVRYATGRASVYTIQDPRAPGAECPPTPALSAPPPRHQMPTTPAPHAGEGAPPAPNSLILAKERKKEERTPKPPAGSLALFAPSSAVLVNGSMAAFEEFWQAYPKRLSGGKLVKPDRSAAEKIFARAIRTTPAADIIAAVRTYPFQLDQPQYIPGPAVWLNKGNFRADVDHQPTGSTGTDRDAIARDWGVTGAPGELERLHAEMNNRETIEHGE